MHIDKDSLKKRYFYKLSTNAISLPISLLTQSIVPRLLGPVDYGSYNYLTNFFNSIFGFFDLGTSTALYTLLSQRLDDSKLLKFYYWIMSAIIFVISFLFFLAYTLDLRKILWPDQVYLYIFLALIWGMLFWILQIFQKIVDAYGYTVHGEKIKILNKIFGVILVLSLYFFEIKKLLYFFVYQYIILLAVIIGFIMILKNSNVKIIPKEKINNQDFRKYWAEFYNYSSPLFISSIFVLLTGLFDRWILQSYAGSIQQGFFGLSFQISTLCFIFTSAMTPLFLRELSIAHFADDLIKMKNIFNRFVPTLFAIAACISLFLALRSDELSNIMGGKGFAQASIAVSIMALYPIHQTYGQLNESVLLATKKTRLYRNLSIISALIGIPFTIFFVGPSQYGFLALGATGLALKMVIVQIIGVNLEMWFNSKILNLSFVRLLFQQVTILLIFFLVSFSIKLLFVPIGLSKFLSFIIEGASYSLVCLIIFLIFSKSLISLNLSDLIKIIKRKKLS